MCAVFVTNKKIFLLETKKKNNNCDVLFPEMSPGVLYSLSICDYVMNYYKRNKKTKENMMFCLDKTRYALFMTNLKSNFQALMG